MPFITTQNPGLVVTGPIVRLAIGASATLVQTLAATGTTAPNPQVVDALIDTGAHGTVIIPGIAQALGLTPKGTRQLMGIGGGVSANEYDVSMAFPNGVTLAGVVVAEAALTGQNIHCLIGRDVLALGQLIYSGYMNQFTLSF